MTAPALPTDEAPRVLLEGAGLVAVDKPAGMPVHAAEPGVDLVTWTRRHLGLSDRTAPAHRVDVEASGVVLLSDEPDTLARVGALFAEGAVEATYLALVFGRTHDKGIVRRPLADAPRGRPIEALTRYRTLERLGGFSLLAVRPATGRKHQVRRHLQGIGHAIVGDTRYPPKRFRPVPAFPGRLWLHAYRIALPDGWEVTAPLPAPLEAHLEILRAGAARAMASEEAEPPDQDPPGDPA